jgi:CRISPR-associated protein Csx10
MKGITFSICTLEPILATSFQGDPNSDVSYSYIPGSMVRGAVIARYLRHHQLSELALNDQLVKDLFFDETKTIYLNAYLLSKEGTRTLPAPLSWFKDKDAKLPETDEGGSMIIYDRALNNELPDGVTPKRVEQKFCTVKDEDVILYSDKRRINIHNFRNRKKGKGNKAEGDIFRYDALDEGQTFQAVILCQDSDVLAKIRPLLSELTKIWLGGSQSAGYGKTEVSNVNPLAENWCEIEIPPDKRVNNNKLAITLLSDTILRDRCGQAVADASLIKPAIEETLGTTLAQPKSVVIYTSSTLIGGFNRKWGLPLPQLPALLAGTIVIFEGITLNIEQVQHLELYGIGERRNEGFGRIAVNWLDEKELQAKKPDKVRIGQPKIEESSCSLANLMLERILRQRLEKQLIKKLGEGDAVIDKANLDNISNSQLSRLWLAAREGLSTGSFSPLQEFLNPENLTKTAREQFQKTKMKTGSDSLYTKINSWLDEASSWIPNTDRQKLEVTITPDLKQGINDDLGNQLIIEYTLRLIMAVAKKAIKEKD